MDKDGDDSPVYPSFKGRFASHMRERRVVLPEMEEHMWTSSPTCVLLQDHASFHQIAAALNHSILWASPTVFLSNGRLYDWLWDKQDVELSDYKPRLQIDICFEDYTTRSRLILWIHETEEASRGRANVLEAAKIILQKIVTANVSSHSTTAGSRAEQIFFRRLGLPWDDNHCRLPLEASLLNDCLCHHSLVSFERLIVDAEACQVLGHAVYETLDLKECLLLAPIAFFSGLAASHGPRHLSMEFYSDECILEQLLAALASNTRLSTLTMDGGYHSVFHHSTTALQDFLTTNKGVQHMTIENICISDTVWDEFWRGMAINTTIHQLDLKWTTSYPTIFVTNEDDQRSRRRTNSIAETLLKNMTLQFIHLSSHERCETIWKSVVLPRLQRNVHLPRFRAMAEMEHPRVRAGVLSKALGALTNDVSLSFLCLLANVETVVEATNSQSTKRLIP
jgi:hypothetical protein